MTNIWPERKKSLNKCKAKNPQLHNGREEMVNIFFISMSLSMKSKDGLEPALRSRPPLKIEKIMFHFWKQNLYPRIPGGLREKLIFSNFYNSDIAIILTIDVLGIK